MKVFSIIETAKANGLNPQKYLQFLLESRPNDGMTDEEFKQLVPWSDDAKEACSNEIE